MLLLPQIAASYQSQVGRHLLEVCICVLHSCFRFGLAIFILGVYI